ncbi:hypothetical protein KCM76_13650 [Zooshikella marina]|uniref:hypothetical protein n=1 Tax=Zooshikella ganghwensis TaxID=202772 RepID=UPI001BAE8CA7|nr:hypothetical protein [Zooshikella ganghwensis]MBU2707034.1 hypothetical protein [Zooshikella ganghwensis]
MSGLLIFLGIVVLLLTFWEVKEEKTDMSGLFDYINPLDYLDISRDKNPLIFWSIILIQFSFGVGLIIYGLGGL